MTDSIPRIKFPELFVGFVAPIGADLTPALDAFRKYFQDRNYRVIEIKVTSIFSVFEKYIAPSVRLIHRTPLKDRYESYIAYGNQLRSQFGDDSMLATSTIVRIMKKRLQSQRPNAQPFDRTAFLLHQFKRKEEIDLLRTVYGRLFFQVSIYSRRGARVEYLSRKFASSENSSSAQRFRNSAEALIQDDENEVENQHGQRVGKIFHDADFIVNSDAAEHVGDQVKRFCELIFGSNAISPTRVEYGMYLAKAAALRSLDLSRQVGAAVFASTGEVLSLGSNEVPRAEGGTYWAGEHFDDRDFTRGIDSNFVRKREILGELASIISPSTNLDTLLKNPKIIESQFMDALEYGRMVHAEMGALCDAARLGHAVRGGTLYCTTFPCHMCAKHIVVSGIAQVIFLEPYPKSLASDLHSDAIRVEGGDRGSYQQFPSVTFEHFYGVSPRRYRELFERAKRKNDIDGKFMEYCDGEARPIMDIKYPFYNALEVYIIDSATKELFKNIGEDELSDA
jgi:deoxycytidylate deaminase